MISLSSYRESQFGPKDFYNTHNVLGCYVTSMQAVWICMSSNLSTVVFFRGWWLWLGKQTPSGKESAHCHCPFWPNNIRALQMRWGLQSRQVSCSFFLDLLSGIGWPVWISNASCSKQSDGLLQEKKYQGKNRFEICMCHTSFLQDWLGGTNQSPA